MKIESPIVGTLEITDDKVIEFPAGLSGFEQATRFALLHDEGGESGLFMLQSLDDPAVMLSATSPDKVGINYEFALSDEESASLGLDDPSQAAVLVILRRDESDVGTPAGAGLRANFIAPLVINVEARRGLQKVINKLGCDITLRALG